jgi:glycerol-3-phosphate dehydrogenase
MTRQTPQELSARTRSANIARMGRERFDLAVIGGGIIGAGVALEAASRGLSVALIEKRDFGGGTSSRSSKLIHGGLRYLQRGQIGLVREALHERETLRRIAPHLSRPLEFVLPIYARGKPSPLGGNRLKLGAGLWLYDLLAGATGQWRHRWMSAAEALRLCPALDADALRGAYVYGDCVTDDARLVIEVVKASAARGALVANYCRATGFISEHSRIRGVSVEDCLGNRGFELRAATVVNATGVWVGQVARHAAAAAQLRLCLSKGIHVVLPSETFQMRSAVLIPSVDGRRFHFVIPWLGRMLVGTTDTPYDGDVDEPRATESEVSELLAAVQKSFPRAQISAGHVIGSFAALRPLVGRQNKPTTDLSRREEIVESDSGLISVFGGKLTTYRAIARRVVNRVLKSSVRRQTAAGDFVLAGGTSAAAATALLPRHVAEHLAATYAGNAAVVAAIATASPEMQQPLVGGLPYIAAEVVYAARHEMAMTVDDVLERRTRLALLSKDGATACRQLAAELLLANGHGG